MVSNGYLPLSSLTRVDGWAYLETNTAYAWLAVCNELVVLGYPRPTITAPDGAYRDYARQVYWKSYWTARGAPANASTPGYSNHGLGTCVDVWDVTKWPLAVLTRVMNKHGFVRDFAPELWHWHRTSINPADRAAALAGYSGTPITPDALPPLPKRIEVSLPIVLNVVDGGLAGVYLTLGADGGYVYPATEVNAAKTVAAPYLNNSINSDGNKIGVTENGVPVKISQQNLAILLQALGFKDSGTIVGSVATAGGGFFSRVTAPTAVSAVPAGSVDLTPVLDAIKAIPAAPTTFVAK